MNVYFFVDELNRDSITAGKLKARLEQRGHKIFYGSRTSIKFLKFLANKKYASINQITKKIIKNNLNIRINTLKTKKLIVRKKKLYRLTNSGLKKVDNIKYIRKLFKLKNLGFYK